MTTASRSFRESWVGRRSASFGSVEADYGEVGGGVGVVGDVGVVVGAEDAVLGGEEGGEGEAWDGFGGFGVEDVDGAVAWAVEAGLVG